MHVEKLLLVSIINSDLITETTTTSYGASKTMKSWIETTFVNRGIDDEINFVTIFKILKVLA